jgi:hypothetical protein
MKDLRPIRFLPPLLFLFLSLFFIASCDLIDEDSCQYSKDEVGEWYNGYAFRTLFESNEFDEGYDTEGYVEEVYLGPKSLVSLNDVCTSNSIVASAELVLKPGTSQGLRKAYLYYVNPVADDLKLGRYITLARTSTDPNDLKLQVQNVEIPAFPDLQSDEYAGKLEMGIVVITWGLLCDEDDRDWVTEGWLSQVIQSAKITVSYTQF